MPLPSPNPKVAPTLRRNARVGAYVRRSKSDPRDMLRLARNLSGLKTYINNDFRGGTLGSIAFDILEHEKVQSTQWGRTVKEFLDSGLRDR